MNSSLAQNYSNIDQVNAFLTSVWDKYEERELVVQL